MNVANQPDVKILLGYNTKYPPYHSTIKKAILLTKPSNPLQNPKLNDYRQPIFNAFSFFFSQRLISKDSLVKALTILTF